MARRRRARATGSAAPLEGERSTPRTCRSRITGWTVGDRHPARGRRGGALRGSLAAYRRRHRCCRSRSASLAALFIARGIAAPDGRAARRRAGARPAASRWRRRATDIARDPRGGRRARRGRRRARARTRPSARTCCSSEQRGARAPPRRRTAPRTSSSPCSATSCATRSARSPTPRALLEHPRADDAQARSARARSSRRQVDHLARLTDDLLDAGRAIMGKIALQRRPLDLAAAGRAQRSPRSRRRAHREPPRRCTSLQPVWVDADPIAHRADRLQPGGQRGQVHAAGRRRSA